MNLSRKQREISERGTLILDVALSMLLKGGYAGLSMDRVATATEYSKGTIYQHFSSKEDLLAGLAVRMGEERAKLFERAATFKGKTRERIGAIGTAAEVFRTLHPESDAIERLLSTPSIRSKASSDRQEALNQQEYRCFGCALAIAREGVAAGDLELPEGHSVESLIFGLWSLYMGSFQIMDLGMPVDILGEQGAHEMMLANAQLFLDGVGWKPLSTDLDYLAARQRSLREIFPEEAGRCGLLA